MNEKEERDDIKKIAQFRATLEKRMEDMEKELDQMKTLLGLIDSILIKKSFKRPQIKKPFKNIKKQEELQPIQTKNREEGIPLKTLTGDILAQIYIENDLTQIILKKDFDINTPPFISFFIERVLTKMQKKDEKDSQKGKLDPDKTLSFEIKQDKNIIRQINIKNLRSERTRELKSSIRWTLEKMYERMKQKS